MYTEEIIWTSLKVNVDLTSCNSQCPSRFTAQCAVHAMWEKNEIQF